MKQRISWARIRWALIATVIIAGAAPPAYADTPGGRQQSFEEYRRGLLRDFNNFRSTIIERYADFLNGEWHEYESYRGVQRDPVPKPRTEPQAPSRVKAPNVSSKPALADSPSLPQAEPEPALSGKTGKDTFLYYGIPLELPEVEIDVADRLFSHSDYAAQWKRLQKKHVAEKLLPGLKKLAAGLGLNDYLTYKLIEAYADSHLAYADLSSRTSLVHFLLVNMGYNVRLGTTDKGVPVLLIPVKQTIYARPYMLVNGLKYYLFTPGDMSINGGSVSTCKLPENMDIGRSMDMRLGELNLPMKPKKFEFQCGPISLTGEVNENLMPLLYHYPQMPVSDYAESNLQPRLRESLVSQLRSQLTGLDGDEAVERLLTCLLYTSPSPRDS